MARNIKKLPKWAIKQAGGINKKAWALARGKRRSNVTRRRKAPKRRRRVAATRSNPGRKSPGIVGKLNAGLRGLRLGLPAIGSMMGGIGPGTPNALLRRYAGFNLETKEFEIENAKKAAAFYAGNVVEAKAMSLMKIPQMAGKKKILALAANFLPEISAVPHVIEGNMGEAVNQLGRASVGYQATDHQTFLENETVRDLWLRHLGARVGLGLASRFVGPMINKHLPKGVNL